MAESEVMVRPKVDAKSALELAQRLWGVRGRKVVQLNGYDDKNFWIQDIDIEGNPNISIVHNKGYVLKVTNSLDSKNADVISGQNLLLQNLAKSGIECPEPQPNIEGALYAMERLESNGPLHAVRLMTFIPGEILRDAPWDPQFARQAGQYIAKINRIFRCCKIAALEQRSIPWSLWSASKCALPLLHLVDNETDQRIIEEVLTMFQNDVILKKDCLNLNESLIHGDFNEQNVLVRQSEEGAWFIAAVLDLGDSHRAPSLFEVAITACYMALQAAVNGVEAADAALRDVVEGYRESGGSFPLNEANLFMLCVCARLAQSLVLGLKAHREDPSNEYVLSTQRFGWPLLRHLWEAVRDSRVI